jgi:OOP family OmpA-OmpF porin
MKNFLITLLGLAGLCLLTYLCANRHRADIEADLTGKTTTQLAGIGLANVKPAAEGQIITLTGEVPDEATKLKAGASAAAVWGVSEVRNLLTVVVPQTPVMTPQQRTEAVSCQGKFDEFLKEPVLFQTGKAVIDRRSIRLLNSLADTAKTCPAAQFEIGGHTDDRGALDMNMKLSQARAQAVLKYLAGRGVDSARMSAEGYGPTKPVAENTTPAGMQKNRRTEFKVKGI